jgi:N-acetylglucosamine-6-phosphate deacetylase
VSARRLGVAAAVVDGVQLAGDVAVADGRILEVGLAPAGRGTAVAGFVDLQVNGFGGVDFLTDADDDAWRLAAGRLVAAGVTAFQPTLITAPEPAVADALRRAARLRGAGATGAEILGVHLEGPFISGERLGAHPGEHRRNPALALLRRQLEAGPVTMMTLAPELEGAGELIEELVRRGVVPSLGHTAASSAAARAAFERGARAVTHVFNAMTPVAGREPGVAGIALARDDVTVMCIVDGVHLADETVQLIARAARGRMALTSDAIAAAGKGDGDFALGTVTVRVRDGRATGPIGELAGGTGSVADAVRRLVELGSPLEDAVAAGTSVPARLLGRDDVGSLRPGARADVVVLDDELRVERVLLGGRQLAEAA